MPTPLKLVSVLAAVLLAACVVDARAADSPHRWHPAPWHPPLRADAPVRLAYAPASAGMTIALDPESGGYGLPSRIEELTLTEIEENMLSRSGAGLVPVMLPSGAVMLDLQGRFQEFTIARVGPDGRIVQDCVSDLAEARALLSVPLAPPTVWEER